DPAAAALAATTLINDLDLRLIDPDGVVYQPYTLDAGNPANVATTGNDDVNNSEMVDGVANAGTWTVTVTGTSVPSGPQQYTLITPEDAAEDNLPPIADANGPYVVDEGSTVALDATGSTDPDGDALTYAWDFDADGAFDDAVGATPIFGPLGDNDVVTVEVRVTDTNGAFDDDTAIVTIDNVPPDVLIDGGQTTTIDEGDLLDVLAGFSDPGWLDTYSADIDWGTGENDPGTVLVTVSGPPVDVGTVTGSHQYGDNGHFTVTVTVTDDDGGVGSDDFALTVDNVDPTATIDESGTVLVNGIPTILASAGDPVDFEGQSTDPGSDDLDLSWDWDDGPPAPDVTTTYLVNPPALDPLPSPTVQPRDVTDAKTHTFGQACMYDVGFDSLDDDNGTGSDSVSVLIVGNADLIRTAGYWHQQYNQGNAQKIDDVTLECYLEIVDFVSDVFDEEVDTSTIQKARTVLKKTNPMESALNRQLLAAWLNFANGSVGLDELVDTDFDSIADTVFYDAMMTAETARLDVGATKAELEVQKDILVSINLMDS
ncbi:MAG: PKD domain-containing protein, partial [Actinomycetota bacterium]